MKKHCHDHRFNVRMYAKETNRIGGDGMAEIKTCPATAKSIQGEISNHATQLSGVGSVSFEGGTVPAIGKAQAVHDRLVGLISRKGSVAARDANKVIQINDAIERVDCEAARGMEST